MGIDLTKRKCIEVLEYLAVYFESGKQLILDPDTGAEIMSICIGKGRLHVEYLGNKGRRVVGVYKVGKKYRDYRGIKAFYIDTQVKSVNTDELSGAYGLIYTDKCKLSYGKNRIVGIGRESKLFVNEMYTKYVKK